MPEASQVRAMFGRIAGRYDLLNRVLSLGFDQRWRGRVVRRAGLDRGGRVVVDVCCGTGDLALAFSRAGARVLGVDFTPAMLAQAERKRARGGQSGLYVCGDALQLPLRTGVAEVVGVAFGLRNLADRRAGLCELVRVTQPGGRVFVLEFSLPPGRLLGSAYRFYFTRLLPWIGRRISGDADAYSYLPRTVLAWPAPAELAREMGQAGLVECGWERYSGGIACLHWGRVPEGARAGRQAA